MIKCIFSDISERDMDLLFLEEFVSSQDFADIFLSKVNLLGAVVCEVEQSKTDAAFGESDITVIVEKDGTRYGLLIEDKIDAQAMLNQAERYAKRGEIGKTNGDYYEYFDFIVAPQKYLDDNAEAKKYHNSITYEECIEYFRSKDDPRSAFKAQQIEQAINKQKHGYQVIENTVVTEFWREYIAFQKEHYPKVDFRATDEPKGSRSSWAIFHTNYKKIKIYHKTNLKYVDLEFSGLGDKTAELKSMFNKAVGKLWDNELQVYRTGGSAVLRAVVPYVDFKGKFKDFTEAVDEAFRIVIKMYSILDGIPENEINELYIDYGGII